MGWSEEQCRGIVTTTFSDGRRIKAYENRAKHVGELFHRTARRHPDIQALKEGGRSFSYEQLAEEVDRTESALRAKEVKKGDRVAILTDNSPEYCIFLLAAAQMGAVTVPLNTRCTGEELEFMINDCNPRVLLIDPPYIPVIEDVRGRVSGVELFVVNDDKAGKGYVTWDDLRSAQSPIKGHEHVKEDDAAVLLYTSGTTGRPKGAMITHFNLCNNVISVSRTLGTGAAERTLIAVPLFHVTGTMFQFLHMMSVGGTAVLLRRFKTQAMMELLANERISFFIGVPTIYILMLINPLLEDLDLSHLGIAAYGGAAMSENTITQLYGQLPGLHLHNTYGATETTGSCTMMPHRETLNRLSSVGLAFPVNEIDIRDENGRTLPAGEIGEIWIKGPNVVKGYWNRPEATSTEFVDGFWRSGDLGRLDEDGFLYLMDRKKDMINRGGEKIFSVEVENVICGHPKVQEVAVVGVPDEIFGEQVKAVIVLKPGERMSGSEVQAYVADHLADYKVPKYVAFADELPRNPGGKVIKSQLKDPA